MQHREKKRQETQLLRTMENRMRNKGENGKAISEKIMVDNSL